MFEKYMIMTRGFKNVRRDGEIAGFQFNVRTTYYRGVYLAIIAGLEVSVNGEEFQPSQIRVAFGGRDYTLDEMTHEEKARWPFGGPVSTRFRSRR
jgi:hypothetical protein